MTAFKVGDAVLFPDTVAGSRRLSPARVLTVTPDGIALATDDKRINPRLRGRLFTPDALELDRAATLHMQLFPPHVRHDYSPEYLAGTLAELRKRIHGTPYSNPYRKGSAAHDAFTLGTRTTGVDQ